ncbi:MAG: circularly permuted type 2 ATP-grasp protein [Herminiimonas sp.]|nr:circularly permuted type 2 ATP-grasp protein [Herminiimonas sp.]
MINPLLAHYPVAEGRYDEMFDSAMQVRPHWRAVFDQLNNATPDLMRERVDAVERQVRENGVTYNIYADPKGEKRPWDLNVVPLILPPAEWAGIEAAVIQRATLLNQILGDVYGEQKMLAEGLLPAALIHGNAGFLRPCHGIRQSDNVALHFYAVDLARAPNGRWWVVADRTQAPSGAGYALENRIVISRAFPELFRDLKVEHIGHFFSTLRDSLSHWGRICATHRGDGDSESDNPTLRDGEQPLIVLLTPGPYNETYYEQTYLARYLGYPLVEGKDLTVRNGLVWLKTISGPQRVHVILRRVDDDFCDPLELRSESALGVVGLTEAARRGTVLIANGLGSNLLESGALLGFLPALSRRLLNEPLKMPSVATWWCGEPAALFDVISRLDNLVLKPAFPQLRQFPVFGKDLDAKSRARFIDELRAQPQNYVAQEMVRISQAPVWNAGQQPGLNAAAVGLRVFACATPNGYVVMPGGLARVATGLDARVITMQRGGASKDTWVQTTGKVNTLSLLSRTTTSRELVRGDTHLSSRLVENLFWFGRYAERSDNMARLMRIALDFLLNVSPEYRGGEWPTIQALCQWFNLIQNKDDDETVAVKPVLMLTDAEIEFELLHAVVAKDVPGLASNLQQLYNVSCNLRERLSIDNWRTLNHVIQKLTGEERQPSLADAITILDDATSSLMTMSGFALDGMTRDHGWRFLSIGRRLERLQFLCTVLQHALKMPPASSLDWLLELSDSIVTYRSRYMAQPEWLPVLDLLILDDSNPRSIVFQLEGVLKYLQKLSLKYGPCGEEIFVPLLAQLQAIDPDRDLHFASEKLLSLLRDLNIASFAVSDHIGLRFFSYTGDINHGTFAA